MWWEHIASWSNPGDGGSRGGILCPVANRCGGTLRLCIFPELPVEFPWVSIHNWKQGGK